MIIETQTIVHPRFDVSVIPYVSDIPRSIFHKKQAKQALNQQPIYIYDGDHNFIIDEIM